MAPIEFGVLLYPFQLTDVTGPIDVLSSSSLPYLKGVKDFFDISDETAERGIDINYHYIAETLEPFTHTGNAKILPNTTIKDCPKLDYLLLGGPGPDFFLDIPPAMAEFVRSRVDELQGVFATCTGGIVAAQMGILDGKRATTNHPFVPVGQKLRPQVKWTAETQWVVDGKFWTAGGALAGMDMFAHWVKEKYGQDVAEAGWLALDFEPRDIHGKLVPRKTGLRLKN